MHAELRLRPDYGIPISAAGDAYGFGENGELALTSGRPYQGDFCGDSNSGSS